MDSCKNIMNEIYRLREWVSRGSIGCRGGYITNCIVLYLWNETLPEGYNESERLINEGNGGRFNG